MGKQSVAVGTISALAILHILIIAFVPRPLLLSNLIQLIAPLLAVLVCLTKARQSTVRYFQRLWYELLIAFLIWTAAQVDYIWHLLRYKIPPVFPDTSDLLCLLYAFPILLVASRAQDHLEKDWSDVLDSIQACIAVCSVYAIVFLTPAKNIDIVVYGIQGIALLFACAIRYSTATTTAERVFFRDLTIYVVGFDFFGGMARVAQYYGWSDGGVTDLAWSLPFLIFCAVVSLLPEQLLNFQKEGSSETILPAHIHGLSSLGLTLTSMTAGILLAIQSTRIGIPLLVISGTVFALRTTGRELQLRRAQLQLEHDNHHDALTGLGNRALLTRVLKQQATLVSRKRSLLFLDLDGFKIINDSLGHAFGDRLLIHVAHILRSTIRKEDTVARLGGDEFVILFDGEHIGVTAEAIAERILHSLRAPILLEGQIVRITASIGVVAIPPGHATTHLLRDADAAMYIAKSLGKNRVHILDSSILEKTIGELKIEADLRRSMEESSIFVGYQPIYSLPSRNLEGFEALARWTHPQRGVIPPSEFIPLAEDTGLIIPLGQQVLKMACYQVALWNRYYRTRLTVSVNVSMRQLADKDFLPSVQEILDELKFDPSLLKFEVTESVLLHDRDLAQRVLRFARAMGIEICLDDFGTGYSSLSYLLEFPFDTIKIDRSFVQDVDHNPQRAEMLRTITQLAKNLNKKVIAEGIETLAQLEFLDAIPCDYVQGFLFSEPLVPEIITELLEAEIASTSPQ